MNIYIPDVEIYGIIYKSPIIKKTNNNVAFGVRMGGMGIAIGSEVGKSLSKLF